jgi:hypothetical protein
MKTEPLSTQIFIDSFTKFEFFAIAGGPILAEGVRVWRISATRVRLEERKFRAIWSEMDWGWAMRGLVRGGGGRGAA